MATVAHVDARFTADTSAYVRGMRDAQAATASLAASMPQTDQAIGQLKTSTIAFGAALGTLGAQALTKVTGKIKEFAKQGINAAKDYEQTVISIEGIFVGMGMTVEKATTETAQYLDDLRVFAAETPFELPQTLDAVKRLLSIGYAADDVKDNLLPAIGDITAALGQPASSISGVVYAFGQMKSAGRVLGQDLMQIGNALPGFNAKVAIAEQLFAGDMQAMAKAMESGSLDSSVAIGAIIKAMQEFPGAAGAMERQSKTLAGVMSTFSDTVNNALIDGLMPSMPMLSEALMGVMPAVQALAEGFAQELGPMLIQGAELMTQLVPIASSVIPPIFELIGAFTGMADIIALVAIPVIAMADALSAALDLFNALPGPVKVAVGVLGTLILVSRRYSDGFGSANKRVVRAFAMLRTGAQLTAGTVAISLTSMRTGMQIMAVTARSAGAAVVASFRAMAVAAGTLLASLGPIGWAMIAVAAAFEFFGGQSAATEQLVSRMKDTVDETTGAFTRLSDEMMNAQFRLDLSVEDQNALAVMGAGAKDMTAAIMEGGPAVEDMKNKLRALRDANSYLGVAYNETGRLATIAMRNFGGMANAATETARQIVAEEQAKTDAIDAAAVRQQAANRASAHSSRVAARDARAGAEETYAATSGLAYAHQEYQDAAVRSQVVLGETFAATEVAVRALQTAYQELTTLFSDIRATDRAYTALQTMKEQLKGNTAGIDEYSEAAMANKDAVLSYAEAQLAVAQSIEDPIAALQVLKTTQQEVADALKGQGIDPKDSDIYNSIKSSIKAAEDAVGEMDTAVENAKTRGLDVSSAIAAGIAAGMTEQESVINAAGTVGGDALAQGLTTSLGISSPSTVAMAAGRNTGLGLIEGLNQMRTVAEGAGMNIGANIVRGMLTSLENGVGPIAAAARRIVAAAIDAATSEGQICSPSRVFMRIGDNVVAGLVIGIEQSTPQVSDAATGMIRSLRDSGEMAIDGFVSGMESRRSAITSSLASIGREAESFSPTVSGQMTSVRAALPTMRGSQGDAMAGGRSGGIHIENLNVTSAPGERAENSIPRNLRRMAWVAGLDG